MGRSLRRLVRWLLIGTGPAGLLAGTRAQAQQDTVAVYVAARSLPRGATLTARDIAPVPRTTRRPSVQATRPEPGWITRRVIHAGEVLASPAVIPPPTIPAGSNVRFVVTRGGIELAVPAVALTAASAGEPISVRLTTPPQRRATGIVAGPARVIAPTDIRDDR